MKKLEPKLTPEWVGKKNPYRTIRIRIADACNYNCSYCSEHDTLPKAPFMEQYDMIQMLENLKAIYQVEQREQHLFIWGGEPTLNKSLLWFLKRVREYYSFITNIELHSNLTLNYPDEFFETINNLNIDVSSSIHLQYKFKTINMLRLASTGNLKEVNLMMDKLSDYDKCKEIKDLYSNKLPISIIPTFQLLDSDYKKVKMFLAASGQWMDQPIECSDTNRNYIEVRNTIDLQGYYCRVPEDSFIVNTNGDIYLCQNDFMAKVKTPSNIFIPFQVETINNFINGRSLCNYKKCDCEQEILKTKKL